MFIGFLVRFLICLILILIALPVCGYFTGDVLFWANSDALKTIIAVAGGGAFLLSLNEN